MRAQRLLCAALLLALAGCGPKYPKCFEDDDCKKHNELCVNGACQQCRNEKDCQPGQTCNKGRCEGAKSTACADDSQCPANQSCIDGACKPCASDDQCGAGGKCNAGKCTRAAAMSDPNANPLPAGACQLTPIYFDFNESALNTEASSAIDQNAECIKKVPGRIVTLTGHSDPRGTEEYNLALSDRRASSVRDRMTRMGVEASRLKTVPKGELEATGTDEAGWSKDRRVDPQW